MRGAKKGRFQDQDKNKEKRKARGQSASRGRTTPPRQSPGAGEHLIMEPTWGQTEGKDTELEQAASPAEAKKLPVRSVNGDVEVSVPSVDGSPPVPGADGVTHILGRFHAKMWGNEMSRVKSLEVDDGPHSPVLLLYQEDRTDEAGRRGPSSQASPPPRGRCDGSLLPAMEWRNLLPGRRAGAET
jgi:hypothetical protein